MVELVPGQRFDQQNAELPCRVAAVGPAQRPSELAQRDRVDPTDGPGQQRQRVLTVQTVGRRREHRQQRPYGGVFGQRGADRRLGHRDPRPGQGARQPGGGPRNRSDDHRHLRPRHAVAQVRAPQGVGDQGRLDMLGRGQPYRDRARICTGAVYFADRPDAGQPARNARDGARHRGAAPMRLRQCDGRRISRGEQRGIGAAEAEHRLVGVAGEQRQIGSGGEHPDQPRRLGVELLGVVDEQDPDAATLGSQQFGIHREGFQGGADEFGRTQRRHGRLWGSRPDGRAQQHHLLVLLREPPGRRPLRAPRQPADTLQRKRVHSPFGAARQQVTQFGGEPGRAQRGPQLLGPGAGRGRSVGDITVQQLADDAGLLGRGDQARRRIPVTLGRGPQHRERVGMNTAYQWLADHGTARSLCARHQQRRRQRATGPHTDPPRTGQQQNRFRVRAGGDLRDRGVDEQAALTGSGSAEHAHHAASTRIQHGARLGAPVAGNCG